MNRTRTAYSGRATPYLFLLPYGVLFIGFIAIPAIYGIWISLHSWDFTIPNKPWVGIDNYKDLFDDSSVVGPDFIRSMRATACSA